MGKFVGTYDLSLQIIIGDRDGEIWNRLKNSFWRILLKYDRSKNWIKKQSEKESKENKEKKKVVKKKTRKVKRELIEKGKYEMWLTPKANLHLLDLAGSLLRI